MSHDWSTTTLTSEAEAAHVLGELQSKRWLCRGQSKRYGSLTPSIDRGTLANLPRAEKLMLERQSIDLFRSTVRFFADQGEQNSLTDDIIALMVLRHYGIPTRLLDWSKLPYVATYFAVEGNDTDDGEIWSFDEPLYEDEQGGPGPKQWKRWPETTSDGSGDGVKFDAKLTAFTINEPPDWFICGFYPLGFPRQNAQAGAYTMTARFSRDHANAIANLFEDRSRYRLYIVPATLKFRLRTLLRENHGIWRGPLFPDSAGAAQTSGTVFQREGLQNRER
jgi:hypothetical protein